VTTLGRLMYWATHSSYPPLQAECFKYSGESTSTNFSKPAEKDVAQRKGLMWLEVKTNRTLES